MMAIVNDENVTVLEHTTEIEMEMNELGIEVEVPMHSLKSKL